MEESKKFVPDPKLSEIGNKRMRDLDSLESELAFAKEKKDEQLIKEIEELIDKVNRE